MSKRVRLLLLLLICCGSTRPQEGAYIHYSAVQGLSSRTIYDVIQDKEGFIWVSSNTGVYRFDGTFFRHFSVEDGIPDNEVLRLYSDKYGRIWFFCFNSKIGFYHKERFYHPGNHAVLNSIPFRNIPVYFYEGRNDILHIKSQGMGYIQLHIGPQDIRGLKEMAAPASAGYWERDSLSYTFTDSGVCRNGRPLHTPLIARKVKHYAVVDSVFYCTSNEGIHLFEYDSFRLVFKWTPAVQPMLKFLAQPDGTFFLLSGSEAVHLRFRNGRLSPIKRFRDVPMPGKAFSDRRGDVWITSLTHGLFYYPQGQRNFRTAYPEKTWPGKIITEMKTCGPHLITGFENGSVAVFDKNLSHRQTLVRYAGNRYSPVRSILFMDSLKLLLTSSEISMHTWHADTLGHITQPALLKKKWFKDCMSDGSGMVYSSSITTLYRIRPLGSGFVVDSLYGDGIRKYAICPASSPGRFWYSNTEGLQILDQGKTIARNGGDSFFRKRIISIRQVQPDRLLLVSDQGGIALADTAGNLVHLLPRKELHNGLGKAEIIGDQLWIAGQAGIGSFRIMRDSIAPVLWLDHNSGLISDDIYAFCLDRDFLYISAADGFQKLNLAALPPRSDTPRLFIHKLHSAGHTWINPQNVDLPQHCKEVQLECSALAFGNRSGVTFSYRFEGSGNFIETGDPFFSIPINFEGKRRLFVRCRKGDSKWSGEQELLLCVPIPLYRQTAVVVLFYSLLLVLAVLISFFIAGRIRKRQVRERDLKLQVASLEMRALQSMMNPHFVFNALNSIQHYINEHDADQGNKYLIKFSRLIRSSLNSSREAMIALGREIEYITNYLDLEQLRFSSKLSYTIDVAAALDPERILVPGMLIQPLVENAVIHAVMTSDVPVHIVVSCVRDGERLLISVCDNGPGLSSQGPSPMTHKSLGLEMIRNRLLLLSEMQGKTYAFHFRNNSDNGQARGATATLELPLILSA